MTLFSRKPKSAEAGSKSASFEDLAVPLVPALYNFAFSLARDRHEAEDLLQEALLKALRGFSSFEAGSNFKAWVFRILRNTFLTSRSGLAARRTVALEDELGEGAIDGIYPEAIVEHQTPELQLIRFRDRVELQAALDKLSSPLLEVILLCDVEEMKYKEIATVLEIPIGTVMSRIARARFALRKLLGSNASSGKETQE